LEKGMSIGDSTITVLLYAAAKHFDIDHVVDGRGDYRRLSEASHPMSSTFAMAYLKPESLQGAGRYLPGDGRLWRHRCFHVASHRAAWLVVHTMTERIDCRAHRR
jgi:hypothetical protein